MSRDGYWYAYKTVASLVQAYGRGMRNEDDYCDTYILDDDIYGVMHRGPQSRHNQRAYSANDRGSDRAPPLRGEPAFKFAELRWRRDKQRTDRANPPAHGRRVASCSSEPRIITLIVSAAPATASDASESHGHATGQTPPWPRQRSTRTQTASARRAGEWKPRHHQRHDHRARSRRRAQHAQPRRSLAQNIAGKDRHQRHRPAQQHHKQIQRERSQQSRARNTYLKPASTTFSEAARCSIRPGRTWSEPTSTRNHPSVPSVNTYTTPAPSSREAGTKCQSGIVYSNPPSAGPVMFAS